eukprot:gene9806-13196_t
MACFSLQALCTTQINYYSETGIRQRFHNKFHKQCTKYPFIQNYYSSIDHPRDKYLIFVFHEPGQPSNGGLGDRLAGMITALAYAIRTNRTFLIVGDEAFEDSFRPYHPYRNDLSWSSWDWALWRREFSVDMVKLHCVNPRPSAKHCALDDVNKYQSFKVIKYYGNRSYLCRWFIKSSLGLHAELMNTLVGTNSSSDHNNNINIYNMQVNLYEIAGCLLRLAISPTDLLWKSLDQSLAPQSSSLPTTTTHQIGIHFRCGDSSFSNDIHRSSIPNPECYESTNITWKGTSFQDDHAMDSPKDEGICINHTIYNSISNRNNNKNVDSIVVYVASDNMDSSQQILDTFHWNHSIRAPKGCHVDLNKTKLCTLSTSVHWFMLSLSDYIIMQALIKPKDYEDSSEIIGLLPSEELAPISAFSRYAAIYSLSSDVIRYGKSCTTVNQSLLALQTHGNWICDPKRFY